MEEVLKQSPQNIDIDVIKTIFTKNNEKVLDTLLELWEIDDKKSKKEENNQKNKWNDIRDICDSFDIEMQKIMKK
jgi:hypothetical protein